MAQEIACSAGSDRRFYRSTLPPGRDSLIISGVNGAKPKVMGSGVDDV